MNPHGRTAVLLALLLVIGGALYLAAGLADAYLAADDFQWLAAGQAFTWPSLLHISGDRFYRPVVNLWFAGAFAACGPSTSCYHALNLTLHLITVSLVFVLALGLFRDSRMAFWGALFFAVEPAYTQAIIWVSGVTTLLATCLYVASLVAQSASWRAGTQGRRLGAEVAAILTAAGALFSHEAAITLPVVSWIMWRQFGPEALTKRRMLTLGLVLAACGFGLLTVLANYRNPVFSESHYAIGVHIVRHALDYIVAMYVGPSGPEAWVACCVAIAILLTAAPATRFGVLWLLITVVPYSAFTWGNVSRYHYLPSIGFAFAVAAALCMAGDRLSRRGERARRAAQVVVLLVAAFVAVRFVKFHYPAARSYVQSMEPWRAYAEKLVVEVPEDSVDRVVHIGPSLESDFVDPIYLEPMLRWLRQDYSLQVVVDRPWTTGR